MTNFYAVPFSHLRTESLCLCNKARKGLKQLIILDGRPTCQEAISCHF